MIIEIHDALCTRETQVSLILLLRDPLVQEHPGGDCTKHHFCPAACPPPLYLFLCAEPGSQTDEWFHSFSSSLTWFSTPRTTQQEELFNGGIQCVWKRKRANRKLNTRTSVRTQPDTSRPNES
uniref:(northern house mosquito) hypothetical protein n=1 Tax=Culex pipiens TaxID=7175 RepID=A0A8D8EW14_CULPI